MTCRTIGSLLASAADGGAPPEHLGGKNWRERNRVEGEMKVLPLSVLRRLGLVAKGSGRRQDAVEWKGAAVGLRVTI